MNPDLAKLVDFFQTLTPQTLAAPFDALYAPNARFKDPFNEVVGIEAIRKIFLHMFDQVEQPRFVVHEHIMQGDQAFLTWDFLFRFKRSKAQQCVRGASHLRFDAAGLVSEHRDYWDAAEELYEKLPLLGLLFRQLRKRLQVK
jgi:hypothetical protein